MSLYLLFKWAMSWIEALRKARRASDVTSRWVAEQLQRPIGQVWYSITITVVMVLLQGFWLLFAFVVGNVLSTLFASWDTPPDRTPQDLGVFLPLKWDTVTQGYVLICILCVLVSYRLAFTRRRSGALFIIAGLPGWFYGAFGAVGATLLTVGHLIGLNVGLTNSGELPAIWILVASGILFLLVTHAALSAPSLITRAWRAWVRADVNP